MASSIATIAMRGGTAVCAALLVLLAAGCNTSGESWSPSIRRNPLSFTPKKGTVVNMNDPYAMAYVVEDVRDLLEAGAWRWTSRRPELRIYLDDIRKLLDRVKCDQPADRHFEKTVPESWLRARWLNFVTMEPDKTWSDAKFTYGFILTRAGFAPN